jgi:hypothetical protein
VARKNKSIAGADYLLAIADQQVGFDRPTAVYAVWFRQMIMDYLVGPEILHLPGIARRQFSNAEAMAFGIVIAAIGEANDRRDAQGQVEAMELGAQLLLRWREYLAAADPSL